MHPTRALGVGSAGLSFLTGVVVGKGALQDPLRDSRYDLRNPLDGVFVKPASMPNAQNVEDSLFAGVGDAIVARAIRSHSFKFSP